MSAIRNPHWTLSNTNHNMKDTGESRQVTVSVPVTDRAKHMCAQRQVMFRKVPVAQSCPWKRECNLRLRACFERFLYFLHLMFLYYLNFTVGMQSWFNYLKSHLRKYRSLQVYRYML